MPCFCRYMPIKRFQSYSEFYLSTSRTLDTSIVPISW